MFKASRTLPIAPMAISSRKIAVLHVAKAQLGLDDDAYRRILREEAGATSARQLTDVGFDTVMRRFQMLGFRSTMQRRDFGERPGMATPKQVNFIRAMWKDYAGGHDEASLNRWLESSFGVTALRFADDEVAGKASVALKAMIKRKGDQ